MYLDEEFPTPLYGTTQVRIRYDCHGEDRMMKWGDANKNAIKNNGKHICRPCWLKSDDNPAKKKENQEKAKQTNLERYGATTAMNTPERIAERVERTFGSDEAIEAWNEKRRKTCLEKYGTEHAMKSDEIKEKQQQVCLENHGVRVPLQSETIRTKMRETVRERYGVDNVAAAPEVRVKMAKTTLERYGVEHYNQLPEMREYLRENCRQWLAESYAAGGPNKGITRPEEWNQKQRETVAKLIVEGNWTGGFKSNCSGRFPATKCKKTDPRFLSSLELIFHFYLNDNDNVEWYNYEAFSIPYQKKDGSHHNYHPDFLVKYVDSEIIHIFETKCWKEKDSLDVIAKQDAAIEFANVNKMTYTLLFDEDVQKLGFDLDKVKNYPGIEFYSSKNS